jgi:hypothetical protein
MCEPTAAPFSITAISMSPSDLSCFDESREVKRAAQIGRTRAYKHNIKLQVSRSIATDYTDCGDCSNT